ncbi:DUF1566 domain-containing protein [Thermodesulfobacteriota bacterium]
MKRAVVFGLLFVCIPCMVLAGGAKEERYVSEENGVVTDIWYGLEWVAGPNEPTNFYEAVSWVESLTVDGGGWRLPTLDELQSLYHKGMGSRNIPPLLKTTGWWIWSGKERGRQSAWLFGCRRASEGWSHKNLKSSKRVFAIRSILEQ